ncbi:GLPGLI family protein [Psychroflexus tropicus]|uniref:GLPGLI family protein n=1 Tax=Psychroflexus tropicus TaxID=197345 RepID=UPI0003700903|nr:GLPGLI family protein [Psychroflexus tropicus]
MKQIILVISFLFSCITYAQDENLVFHFQVQKNFLTSDYDLILGGNIALWKEMSDPKQSAFNPTYIPDEDYKRKVLFKNLKSKEVISEYDVLGAHFFVKDSLHNMTWTLVDNETKKILGYDCKKAKTIFHGREYEVFYSDEIAISNGPWKFGGLPGMILKVVAKSNKENYNMECYSIEKHKQNIPLEFTNYLKKNKKKKFQTWDEFVLDFNSFLDRYVKSLKSEVEADGDSGFTLHFSVDNHLEIFSEKVQTDGILLEF